VKGSRAQIESKWGQKLDHDYNRVSAWTDKQNDQSNEYTFKDETDTPSGYEEKLMPKYHQKKAKSFSAVQVSDPPATIWRAIENDPRGKYKTSLYPQDYRDHAWTETQAAHTNESSWVEETRNPSGYLDKFTKPESFVQKSKETYPAADSKSWIEPYSQRDHAWNETQHDQSNEKEWKKETETPTGYQVTPYSTAQKGEKKATYPAADSKSWIEPYDQRHHAWNESQHDQSNEKEWK